ncbi:hypothetical protein C731_3635 [Mycolicibacterium hassiacum DSM 44199]|jgi:hypothetical protein|uniref:Uncharacterized protein n=1 Tax=Mycolicibacterium hassiacum (strain DSM 44199 / CIP 105218 / JCM 12690 / 3849) TaxID=1122247 RepID=K5BAJ9_MYCHD|nr:septation protein SepH [Mycolicibacterium hassiacum]EKF22370.1 hypothetical protein C731_3635 [Mycolicibacterium hassiacum DSM 44199]MBX5486811.1 DUF3071 domain-containing protein [Mycolicibacterium hassiacum]MDA4087580.1 hypothetical protein [Mycolicibacterium hassiacum DSM 44199]VCT91789.1 hypothetical protein MHAS_03508 [Mycolicibacterium hassiacum DSM 44199]
MRELKVVGLDVDGKRIICEAAGTGEKFILLPDERLRAAMRGERTTVPTLKTGGEGSSALTPREIQARIRAGATVEQVAAASGMDVERVQRFAHPVLLERSRAAELAAAAHPVLSDGPSVLTLQETVASALIARGLDPESTTWDAWRNEDGRWTVQLAWKAGMSDNVAHFRFTPGSNGGVVTAFDDAASELINPDFNRPLRPVAPVAPIAPDPQPTLPVAVDEQPARHEEDKAPAEPDPAPTAQKSRSRKRKPSVPAWEDVLLGVRSGGQR